MPEKCNDENTSTFLELALYKAILTKKHDHLVTNCLLGHK